MNCGSYVLIAIVQENKLKKKLHQMETVKKNKSEGRNWAVLVGDLKEFMHSLEELELKNDIIEKHISSQVVQVANPNYIKGISMNQPEVVTTVYISALIHFKLKPHYKI